MGIIYFRRTDETCLVGDWADTDSWRKRTPTLFYNVHQREREMRKTQEESASLNYRGKWKERGLRENAIPLRKKSIFFFCVRHFTIHVSTVTPKLYKRSKIFTCSIERGDQHSSLLRQLHIVKLRNRSSLHLPVYVCDSVTYNTKCNVRTCILDEETASNWNWLKIKLSA